MLFKKLRVECKRQTQVSAVKCLVKEEEPLYHNITYTLLSLDTSLQKPVPAVYNLPAIFEHANSRKLISYLCTIGGLDHPVNISQQWYFLSLFDVRF